MRRALVAGGAGALFGVGLCLSGMTEPAKVLGFLDVFGHWDPSMMFVMMGAVLVHLVLYRLIRRREQPLFDTKFHLPTASGIDRKLLLGAAVFGAGWGLGGFCPGPALVSLATGARSTLAFVGAMIVGMVAHHVAHTPRAIEQRSVQDFPGPAA
jgi:uncharacterized membrane protein YedE/YeeE